MVSSEAEADEVPDLVDTVPGLRLAPDTSDLAGLPVIGRFEKLIGADAFPAWLCEEVIEFDRRDPIYGYCCGVGDCAHSLARASLYCSPHERERQQALAAGIAEPDWLASAVPGCPSGNRTAVRAPIVACGICPDRDAVSRSGLCRSHANSMAKRRAACAARGETFDEERWRQQQRPLPSLGRCAIRSCVASCCSESARGLCTRHWRIGRKRMAEAVAQGRDPDEALARWIVSVEHDPQGQLDLSGLPRLVELEIRYGLFRHAQVDRAAKWFPAWLRTLVAAVRKLGVNSLRELSLEEGWVAQQSHVDRIAKEMIREVERVHVILRETRNLGYVDPAYWGVKLKNRLSAFDLTGVRQDWLREVTWNSLAADLDSEKRPRSSGPFEARRRAVICLSAYLHDYAPEGGHDPTLLTDDHAREFLADLTRRITENGHLLGVFDMKGRPTKATALAKSQYLTAIRKVLRGMLETGAAQQLDLNRAFILQFPRSVNPPTKHGPRPLEDDEYDLLADPASAAILSAQDPNDIGVEDIWFIQQRAGRRITEVVQVRFDCIREIKGRPCCWFDQTKNGNLDYAVFVPREVYERIQQRQEKTAERFRLKFGRLPSAKERQKLALFPSTIKNPRLEVSITTETFWSAFRELTGQLALPGVVPHQARHTLATNLHEAGASPAVIKSILGNVSDKTIEIYTRISDEQRYSAVQKVWVKGPGAAKPGALVSTPTMDGSSLAHDRLIDISAIPTEHGLCTFKPVVGGEDCPYGRKCDTCEEFVVTGADYTYWKRKEEQWSIWAENAPNDETRTWFYGLFERSSQSIAGLEKALSELGLLEEALRIDLRSPHQDMFQPIWTYGWRAKDLAEIAALPDSTPTGLAEEDLLLLDGDEDPADFGEETA
jgi:integrase